MFTQEISQNILCVNKKVRFKTVRAEERKIRKRQRGRYRVTDKDSEIEKQRERGTERN